MKGIKNYIKSILNSSSLDSSKRFFAMVDLAVMIIIAFVNLIFQKPIDPVIFNGLLTVFLVCMGVIGVENVASAIKAMRQKGINIPDSAIPPALTQENPTNGDTPPTPGT